MKTVYFLKDHCRHKKGDTVTFLVDNHAESLIANGVATDMIDTAEKPKKTVKN